MIKLLLLEINLNIIKWPQNRASVNAYYHNLLCSYKREKSRFLEVLAVPHTQTYPLKHGLRPVSPAGFHRPLQHCSQNPQQHITLQYVHQAGKQRTETRQNRWRQNYNKHTWKFVFTLAVSSHNSRAAQLIRINHNTFSISKDCHLIHVWAAHCPLVFVASRFAVEEV